MNRFPCAFIAICIPLLVSCAAPKIASVSRAMQHCVDSGEVAGATTVVVTKDKLRHLHSTGFANIAQRKPMGPDTLFWVASMTKPVTAAALLMLQDEGKLNLSDPVAKYIPEFASLKTPSGKPANLTIAQLMTHTSGLGEAEGADADKARSLADLVALFLKVPLQFEPGTEWRYCQSGINTAARIVEIASGKPFDVFLQERLFDPLGMQNTTFYPSRKPALTLVTPYRLNSSTGKLEPKPPSGVIGEQGHPPLGNSGLFSTGPDYARFCQMLLGGGVFKGKRYLSPESFRLLSTPQTRDLPTGFFQSAQWGNRGTNYGWGIGTCVLRAPHAGVAEMLSPGTFGHGGAWGTQAWIDPVRGLAFVLMIQRSDLPMSDGSEIRRGFQQAAVDALK